MVGSMNLWGWDRSFPVFPFPIVKVKIIIVKLSGGQINMHWEEGGLRLRYAEKL